jgi:GDPmannose 4,6-dehydratase
MRPEELPYLKGDATKIKKTLGWTPEIGFKELVEEMLEFWLQQVK